MFAMDAAWRVCTDGNGWLSVQQVVESQEGTPRIQYSTYDSPLTAYPLLRSRLERDGDVDTCVSLTSRRNSSIANLPDLKPLKQAALQRMLTQLTAHDPGLRVCQYEVPGGGVCRDQECDELHLSRIGTSEPSGTWRACPER